jgi:hypothetical protein
MKTVIENKQVYELRLEELMKLVLPEKAASVDYDSSIMRLKDGATILVLELKQTVVK